jgi:hypothetical protein
VEAADDEGDDVCEGLLVVAGVVQDRIQQRGRRVVAGFSESNKTSSLVRF